MRFIYEKEGKRFEYHIPEGNMIVGRDRKVDIAIFDHNISRHHITVVRRDVQVMIRDLGSRNGTFVNNTRVTESELKPGDILRLGNLSLFFDDGSPGLEIPSDLEGHMAQRLTEKVDDTNPTPVDGTLAPPPLPPPVPPPAAAPAPGAALPVPVPPV
ncbi:MAG: FHA domain-containing protein, partial [Planctomycetota bacterium]